MSCSPGKASNAGQLPDKKFKHRRFIHAAEKIRLGHRDLIQIREQGAFTIGSHCRRGTRGNVTIQLMLPPFHGFEMNQLSSRTVSFTSEFEASQPPDRSKKF
jgi:hypothetical protein